MWRIGVLLLATVLIEFAAAGVKPTDENLVQRLKRSPNSCDPYDDYQRRPRYWPPGPPPGPHGPPFWPPPPGPPPYWAHRRHRHRFDDFPDDITRGEQLIDAASRGDSQEPCPTCEGKKGVSSALSNAKSENGDAIAVAIAKASPKTS